MTSFGIGAPVRRREDVRLLTGQGRYADDINAPGQAYAAFVRSPHAHADVVAIDAAPARGVAGVLGVFTGRDLVADGVGTIPTLIAERGGGIRNRDGSPFAEPAVVSAGDGSGASRRRAHRDRRRDDAGGGAATALDAVAVDYAVRPLVVDAVAALADGAPSLHDGVGRNRCYDWECGDAAATARAIAAAAHVTRLTLLDNRLVTCFLEPRAALAEWDPAAERYTLHASLQSVHALAVNLARILRVPAERVRCVTADVGGGFGSKIQPYPEYAALAWAARRVGRPLKWASSRTEGFLSDAQSRDHVLTGELALDASGHVTALRVHSTQNLGAYVATGMPISIILNMERMVSGLYAIPAIHLQARGRLHQHRADQRLSRRWPPRVRLHRRAADRARRARDRPRRGRPAAPQHGPDVPVSNGHRRHLRLRRLRRAPRRGARACRRRPVSRAARSLRAARHAARASASARTSRAPAACRASTRRCASCPTGIVEVPIGSQSQGQGHETVFAQVVAERLGVPFETVHIVMGDTDRVADGVGTFASRSMVRGGSAAVEASDLVVAAGKRMAAHLLEAAVADIEYRDGAFTVVGTDRSIGIFDVARAAGAGTLPAALGTTLGAAKMHENRAFAFANGCEVCELEVDPETGAVTIAAWTVVDDSGRSVNPMIVHGQMHGAVAQGVGQALTERCVYDPASGQLLSGSFLDYAVPRADDLPAISVTSRDVPSPTNPLGVKGAGEGATVGAPGAVIHAILDALAPLGVTHIDMPATPARVWQAIQSAR